MYDRKNEPNEFVAETVEDATAAAARFYGVEADDLKVAEAEVGEVAGAGGRTVVVAFPKDMKIGQSGGGDRSDRDGDRPRGRGRDRDRDGDRGGRGRGRDRDRGGDRGDRGDRGGREERGGRGRREERGDREEKAAEAAPAPAAAPKTESKGEVKGEIGEVGQFVVGLVERLKVGGFEISESAEDDFLVYQLRGEASDALAAGDGRATDAIQLLANQAAKRDSEDPPRVVIDVEGDAEDREDSLDRLANRAAGRALQTGRSVALDPMNSRDRRMVHVALKERDQVATMSIGSGRYRQVLVVPEGAPEYDEAVEASK
jgi:spoIIIJ-associated protein